MRMQCTRELAQKQSVTTVRVCVRIRRQAAAAAAEGLFANDFVFLILVSKSQYLTEGHSDADEQGRDG